jgi:hypothetical protein
MTQAAGRSAARIARAPAAALAKPRLHPAVRGEKTAAAGKPRRAQPAVGLEFGQISVEHRPGKLEARPPARQAAKPRITAARTRTAPRARKPSSGVTGPSRREESAGVHGGPSPPAWARDPATLIESVRREAARSELPYRELFGSRLGIPLGNLEVYRGTAARRVCELLGARALAARNVLLFAEDAPSVVTVAHEVAHVLQQRAHRSQGPPLVPGSLQLSDPSSGPEREAHAVAHGALRWHELSAAPAAAYRDEAPESDAESKRRYTSEQNFALFIALITGTFKGDIKDKEAVDAAKARYAVKDLGETGAVFARAEAKKDDLTAAQKLKRSSPEKFQLSDVEKVLKGMIPDDPAGAVDFPNLVAKGKKEGSRTWQLSTVGKSEDSRRYALTETSEIEPDNYQKQIFEIGALDPAKSTPEGNAKKLADYREICSKRIGNPDLNKWAADWKPKNSAGKVIDETAKDKVTNELVGISDKELESARHEMVKKIVETYKGKLEDLFTQVIQAQPNTGVPFVDYPRIQGNIFEDWLKAADPKLNPSQPIFPWPDGRRMGDFVIDGDAKKPTIGEAKGVAAEKPSKENKTQIEEYRTILTKPIAGRYKIGDTVTNPPKEFSKVRYFFPNEKVAKGWTPVIEELGNLNPPAPAGGTSDGAANAAAAPPAKKEAQYFEVDQRYGTPKDEVPQGTGLNPIISITVTGAKSSNTKHRVEPKTSTTPGIKVKYYEVVLKTPGYPEIESAELAFELDAKGAPLSAAAPTIKKVTPVSGDSTPAPAKGAAKPKLTGTALNGLDKVEPSGLDKFLKKVHTEVNLTDKGLGGRIWVDPTENIIKGLNLTKAEISLEYGLSTGFHAKGDVAVAYARDPSKFSGGITVEYKQGKWTFHGTGTVSGLIGGLDTFTVDIDYDQAKDLATISGKNVHLKRKVAGVNLEATVAKLVYDVNTGGFNAEGLEFNIDLGVFGKAGAKANIENNELTKLTFDYESKALQYPKGNSPLIAGKLKGSVTYDKGQFDGTLGGTAYLKIPALEKINKSLGDLGFVIDVTIKHDGKYSGSIALAEDKPILLGDYLRIPKLELKLGEDGSITSVFSLEVTEKLKYVKQAKITCSITKDGKFVIGDASIAVKIGDDTKDRVAAELALSYDGQTGAFVISGTVWVRIKEGIVAVGTLTYNSITGKINGLLYVKRIPLLGWTGHKPFLDFKKQIILVSIYGIGIYLDLGFKLGFDYTFNLGITPVVSLQGLKWDTFEFELAVATVTLDGKLIAELKGTPSVGLGLFILSPKLLRGGGGVSLPISAKAVVDASGTVQIQYKPDGTVQGGGRVGLTLSFGITAALKPYAEFSVLDGVYEPTWEGDTIKEFVIMEERELYTHFIDFGQPLKPAEGEPPMAGGTTEKKPPPPASGEQERKKTTQEKPKGEDPPKGKRDDEGEKPKETPAAGKKEGGFDFMNIVGNLLDSPKFAPIKKVLDAASKAWDRISGVFKAIYNFFKNWFDVIKEGIESLIEAIQIIAKDGLIAYFKQLLKRKLGAFFDIIEPLFKALEKSAGKFEDLIAKLMDDPIPLTLDAFLGWVLTTVGTVFNIVVGSIHDLVRALGEVLDRAADAFLDFVNHLVKKGKIGVRRFVYYIPGIIHNSYFYAATQYKIDIWGYKFSAKVDGDLVGLSDLIHPSQVVEKAVAYALWKFLSASSRIEPTDDMGDDSDVKDDTRKNYWAG